MTNASNRQLLSRRVVKVVVLLLGLALSNHKVLERAVHYAEHDSWFALSVLCATWFACLLSVFYCAFTPAKGWQLIWTIVIGFSTLLGETLYRTGGQHLTLSRVDELLSATAVAAHNQSMTPVMSFGGVIALLTTGVLLTGLLMSAPTIKSLRSNGWGIMPVLPLTVLMALAVYVGENRGRELLGMPSQFVNVAVIAAYAVSPRPSMVKRAPSIQPVRKAPVRHILLIIDESVAGDFIDLNRPRGTTPFLQSRSDQVVNFGLALAAHNCSENSNAILRLGAAPQQPGNPADRILNNPSIWQYAAQSGFETRYINAQFAHETWQYHFNENERVLLDHLHSGADDTPWHFRDRASLQLIQRALESEQPQFIVLVKNGTHTPYARSHPADKAHFQPALSPEQRSGERQSLVNSYRNAIRWNVDQFFSDLMALPELKDFALIYTSDHGQNLMDDGTLLTHCRRIGQTLSEVIVPLLAITDSETLERRFRQGAELNFNSASHFQVFPTLLDLLGYAPEDIRNTYYYSLFESVDQPLGFLSGPIMGRFGAQPTWNPRKGMEDFKR